MPVRHVGLGASCQARWGKWECLYSHREEQRLKVGRAFFYYKSITETKARVKTEEWEDMGSFIADTKMHVKTNKWEGMGSFIASTEVQVKTNSGTITKMLALLVIPFVGRWREQALLFGSPTVCKPYCLQAGWGSHTYTFETYVRRVCGFSHRLRGLKYI